MIGAMRDRILIKGPVDIPAAGAGADTIWILVLEDWCQAVPISSDKRLINSQQQLQDGYTFTVRYRSAPQPNKSMLIEYNGADYSIEGIEQIMNNRQRFWRITATTNGDSVQAITTT